MMSCRQHETQQSELSGERHIIIVSLLLQHALLSPAHLDMLGPIVAIGYIEFDGTATLYSALCKQRLEKQLVTSHIAYTSAVALLHRVIEAAHYCASSRPGRLCLRLCPGRRYPIDQQRSPARQTNVSRQKRRRRFMSGSSR